MKHIKLENLLAYTLILLVSLSAFNALARFLGKQLKLTLTSNFFLENQSFLFSIIFLLGGIVAMSNEKHIRVDLFFSNYSEAKQKSVSVIGLWALVFPTATLMLYMSLKYWLSSVYWLEGSPNPGGIPRYVFKSIMPLSFLLLLVHSLKTIKR